MLHGHPTNRPSTCKLKFRPQSTGELYSLTRQLPLGRAGRAAAGSEYHLVQRHLYIDSALVHLGQGVS
jgi:hypothetical protein